MSIVEVIKRVPVGPTKTYTITASPDVLERFEVFLAYVQWCANVGHSTIAGFPIDGDGADRFRVLDPELSFSEKDNKVGSGSAEVPRW